jgi:hypothetical protein
MKDLWYRPHWRNAFTHGLAFFIAIGTTLFVNYQFNQQVNACKALEANASVEKKREQASKCNKLFENLDRDLDPWVYILLGFNTYLVMYGWASGNVSVLTAMETKPQENEFKVKRPSTDNEELYQFGYYFARVLKSETQLVINPELIFFDEFFNFKFTGFVKRDLFLSAIFASYPYLDVKTQDSLRVLLANLTLNTNDRFDVSEVSWEFLILATKLGHKPTSRTLKLTALSKALKVINCPDMASLDLLKVPDSINPSDFTNSVWQGIFDDWTKISNLDKSKSEVQKIYDVNNPIVIDTLDKAQDLFDNLFS